MLPGHRAATLSKLTNDLQRFATRLLEWPGCSRATLAVLATASAGVLLACGGGAPPAAGASGSVAFREVAAGRIGDDGAAPAGAQGRLARTAREARALLRRWSIPAAAVPQLGGIDFGRRVLVVVLADQRPSGGYRARVQAVERTSGALRATVAVRRPAGTTDLQVISRPWVVVSVPRAAAGGAPAVVRVRLR
jgi:hypothetical protein